MKKLLAFIFLTSLVVYAGLPPTSLKGGNEASLQTTFQFDLGQIPVTRTGTNVTFGTIPVTQGGTSATSLTQYALMSGNGTGAVNMIAPAASGTLLFSNGASAFPSYRLLASSDITTSLGYTPLASTTAAIISTLGYTPLNRANNLSDLASSATARTNLGLGSLATKSVIDLGSADVTGTTSVVNGGTGLSSTSTNSILVGSGTTNFKNLAATASGAVLSLDESGNTNWLYPETNSIVNYASNPSFEQSTTGWVASGSVSLLNYDRSGNGVPYLKGDKKYLAINTGSTNAGACSTQTVPQNMRGTTVEISTQYRNGFDASGTWVMQATVGSQVVSQTIALDPASSTTPYSDSFLDSPKMFVGTTSSTATVQLCLLRSSGTAWLHVDNVWVGSPRSLANGAILTALKDEPGFTVTNGGTITNASFRSRRDGSMLEVFFKFTTASNGDLQINIPGYVVDSILPAAVNSRVGSFTNSTTGAYSFNVLTQPGLSYLYFGLQGAGSDGLTRYTGWGASTFSGSFKVPISGWKGTGVTYESRCPNDISCANEFSAKISGTTVTSENLDWISSVGLTDTSLYTITFNSGVFTDAPNCLANASRVGIPSTTMSIESVTSSTVAVRGRGDTGALQATDFFVQCNKSTDYVAKKTITGYLSNTVTTSGQYLERMERVKFAGNSTGTTNCTTSPCTIISQSGGISSVTRNSTGNYTLNFPSGNFSQAASCTGRAISVGVVAIVYVSEPGNILGTPTAVTVGTYNSSSGAAIDASVDVICMGPR